MYVYSQIYWLGDLNYRITEMDAATAKQYISEGIYSPVLVLDQLGHQRKAGRVFQGFQEAEIDFKPTYKYDPGTDNWDSRYPKNYITFLKRNLLRKFQSNIFIPFFFMSNDV